MNQNKITGRVLLFNLILSTITHSMALKCYTKADFSYSTDQDSADATMLLDGADKNDCADGETRCITVTGSFQNIQFMYKVKKLLKCASTDLCDGTIDHNKLALLLKNFDKKVRINTITAGDTETKFDCCEEQYCNKLADEVAPTTAPTAPTAPSSGYKTLRSICFFVAMSILIWTF